MLFGGIQSSSKNILVKWAACQVKLANLLGHRQQGLEKETNVFEM